MVLKAALALLLLTSAGAAGPVLGAQLASAPDRTPPGTKLKHFNRVDEGVYKGSKPRTDADFKYLRSLNIKYIVDLEFLPTIHDPEKSKARKYGIEIIPIKVNASPVSPSSEHIDDALSLIRNRRCQPVYFHCALGRDRTALIATLYKMYFEGMPRGDADRYLHASGYKDGWLRSGLTRYLDKHPTPPPSLVSESSEACSR